MKKRVLLLAVTALCFASINLFSQIYVEFQPATKIGGRPYVQLQAGSPTTVYTATDFKTTPNVDPDDGFAVSQLPFTFEYNGVNYNWIAVNVNGFVMMLTDQNVPLGLVGMHIPTRLFDGSQFPRNVIAPFWGDHYFRVGGFLEPGYMASQVLTRPVIVNGRDAFCVEWRNLNINDKTMPSSVGNFQLYLYKQVNLPGNNQGDIEFAYGQIGGNTNTPLTTVITRNAAVGMKGNSNQGDWINGLEFSGGTQAARTSVRLTNQWQPSGGSDTVISFSAIPRLRLDVWGDGDGDFSQAPGARHYQKPQNQFVTANDALTVLRSVASNIPLDSLYRRMAYKADVDHNGRFYYSTRNSANTADVARYRREVTFRTPSNDHTLDMPNDNSLDYSAIYFQVNAYDAALIMHYLGGRVVQLPWTLDSIVPFGKVGNNVKANDIRISDVTKLSEGIYRLTVNMNGQTNSPISSVFNVNGEILSVTTPSEMQVLAVASDNKVAIAGSVNADETMPIAYVTVKINDGVVKIENNEFNGFKKDDISIAVKTVTESTNDILSEGTPNPFSGSTSFKVNIVENGFYTLNIYNSIGKIVRTIVEGELVKGEYTFEWNGNDNAGNNLDQGMYIFRLEGTGINTAKKVVLDK